MPSILLLALFGIRSFAATPCPQLYRFAPHIGERVGQAENQAEFLGAGMWGRVYRIRREGKPQIWKTYSNSLVLENDIEGFRVLEKISEAHPGVFAVSRVLKREDYNLFLENVEGRTLEDVVKKGLLPSAEIKALKSKYQSLLNLLETDISNRFPVLTKQREKLSAYPRWSGWESLGLSVKHPELHGGKLIFFFKPDNILVDPVDLHLTIIDPY